MEKTIIKCPFSCQRERLTIRGHIFRQAAAEGKKPAIILSHGFLGDEAPLSHYAEVMVKIGYTAVTFDFNGGGPKSTSSGNSIDMTVLTEKEDLLAVVKYISSLEDIDSENISLMGFSQGGFVSALAAAQLKDRIKKLILFFPALCIPDHARQGKMMLMTFDPENPPPLICQDPMPVGRNYALTAQKLDPYKEISGFEGETFIIHGTADKAVNVEYSRKARSIYKKLVYKEIEGAGHGFTGADDEAAIRAVTDFCKLAE
ncbi:MAG: alpha/beta hydrolase [Treponemataceae bacterium]|nr:alpha/beta hydrolase [Treponemataceae bacterium]